MNPRAPRGDLSSVFAPTREGTAINRFIPVDVTARFSSLVVDSFPRPITARDTTSYRRELFLFFQTRRRTRRRRRLTLAHDRRRPTTRTSSRRTSPG